MINGQLRLAAAMDHFGNGYAVPGNPCVAVNLLGY
jgi:hypothetical protein